MSAERRRELIKEIEDLRGTRVISYVTSTRGGLETPMAMDVIPFVFEHLRLCGSDPKPKLDLFIHSNGGDGVVPWRLVTLIREFTDEFTVIVPDRAFSAATLTALGADHILMHEMGVLGPTDPSINGPFNPSDPRNPGQPLGISVEDVASYIALVKDDVGIRHEDELVKAFLALAGDRVHPLALGSVKRTTSQSRMIGIKLLGSRRLAPLEKHEMEEIIHSLTSELFYHGHPINRVEARELGLKFVEDAEGPTAEKIWELFSVYAADLNLLDEFNAMREVVRMGALPDVPAPNAQPNVTHVKMGPLETVLVESVGRSDVFEIELDVTSRREWTGNLAGNVELLRSGWVTKQ